MQISKLHAGNTEYDTFDSFNFACVIACILRKVFIHKKKKGNIISLYVVCGVSSSTLFSVSSLVSFLLSVAEFSIRCVVGYRTHTHSFSARQYGKALCIVRQITMTFKLEKR